MDSNQVQLYLGRRPLNIQLQMMILLIRMKVPEQNPDSGDDSQ